MFDSDQALVVDFDGFMTDPASDEVSCSLSAGTSNSCPAASTLAIANEYAASNTVWLNDFRTAFIKMTNLGCEDDNCLKLVAN
jgi:hypothetical protein